MTRAALMLRVLAGVDPLGPVDQDPDQIREAACRIVAADQVCSPPEVEPPDDAPDVSWLSGIVELLFWVLFVALVAALLYFVVRTLMTTRRGTRRKRRTDNADVEDDDIEELASVAIDRTREPADWRSEAEQHRVAGRFRDAIRCRYRALVGDLARRGLIDEIPGRTSGEERLQMAEVAPGDAPTFAAAAELFDRAWFGDVPLADGDVAQIEVLESSVLSSTGAAMP